MKQNPIAKSARNPNAHALVTTQQSSATTFSMRSNMRTRVVEEMPFPASPASLVIVVKIRPKQKTPELVYSNAQSKSLCVSSCIGMSRFHDTKKPQAACQERYLNFTQRLHQIVHLQQRPWLALWDAWLSILDVCITNRYRSRNISKQ